MIAVPLALIHLAASMLLITTSFMDSMHAFDEPTSVVPPERGALYSAAGILLHPAKAIWDRFGGGVGNAPEWILFALNSALWGFALALPLELLLYRRSRGRN
jgi:hypothetical protein